MQGTTRHICRDQHDEPIRGDRKKGEKKGHLPGCRSTNDWCYAVRCPTKEDAHYYLRRAGFETKEKAAAELNRVIALLDLAGDSEPRRRQIGSAIRKATVRGRPLDEDRIRREVGADRDPSLPVPTVGQWAEDWLAGNGRLRPGTRVAHRRRITNYLVPWLGDIPLDTLRNVHVKNMLDGIRRRSEGDPLDHDPPDERARQSDAGPAMRSKLLDLLRTLVKAAVDENVITRNPIATFRSDEEYTPPEHRFWSPEEAETFLAAASDDRLAIFFQVAVVTGLRRGELLGLRWSDLDLDARVLRVQQQVSWFGGKPATGPPKTKKSRRKLQLDAATVTALRRHRREQKEEQLRAGPAWRGAEWGLVFCTEDGAPLRPYAPLFTLRRIAEEVGVPVLTLHQLRHTNATIMASKGVPWKVISERLGHATVALTINLYAHVLTEDDQAAADTIARAIERLGEVVS